MFDMLQPKLFLRDLHMHFLEEFYKIIIKMLIKKYTLWIFKIGTIVKALF